MINACRVWGRILEPLWSLTVVKLRQNEYASTLFFTASVKCNEKRKPSDRQFWIGNLAVQDFIYEPFFSAAISIKPSPQPLDTTPYVVM